ncbi:MAG: hypothetical protein OFPI_43280 [Osedax symbiont Rs2]|nr:MAG: hypothetical protein OFPI_43280 [Osedax symbiont Rs2]
MCGFFEFTKTSPQAISLIEDLVPGQLPLFRDNRGVGPAADIDIIIVKDNHRTVVPAIWWLLLNSQLKPSKYTSFNTRWDKLNLRNTAGFIPYRQSRCIIPATAIVEGEGAKGQRIYHHIAAQKRAFAMAGLYRQWINKDTKEQVHACSIITLAPHPDWQGIHSKSTPMFLPVDDQTIIEKWLDPSFSAVDEFSLLLTPVLRDTLLVTPIDKPSTRKAIAESFCI